MYASSLILGAMALFLCQGIVATPMTFRKRQSMLSEPIYPQKGSDPAYSVAEADLQAAIMLPANFTYGVKMAVLLSPGTGVTGSQTFSGNFQKQLSNSSTMEPVVLNIPDNLLDDVQTNAEYVAYAINYVSGISNNKNVSIITWSQGSIDMQWAVKYFTSTRSAVSDFIAVSPDLKGSAIAGNISALGAISIAPALWQQANTSTLIATLRANGGDAAIVPTTAIYSSADEVVKPQIGDTASGFFQPGVGASNSQVQTVCPNQAAGGNFTHEGMLYNSLAFALAVDAMSNPGPANVNRLDLKTVCAAALSPGLTAADKSTTDATIGEAAANILAYTKGVTAEPPIKAYAAKDTPMKNVVVSKRNDMFIYV